MKLRDISPIAVVGGVLVVLVAAFVLMQRPAVAPEDGDIAANAPVQIDDDVVTNEEALATTPMYEVRSEGEVAYFEDARGFYAAPVEEGFFPGVVMIHEWWGLNQHIKDMAVQLAGQGYRVLAVDLYGTVASTPEEARALTGALDQKEALENMRAAIAYLRGKGADRIASLGWCFGGGQSMQLALSGEQLDATVIYYGQLVTEPAKLQAIDWPVLGVFGEADQAVKVESVRAFDAALDEAGVENEIHIYPDVGHAFANPSGANYAPEPTRDAWMKTLEFLREHLRS